MINLKEVQEDLALVQAREQAKEDSAEAGKIQDPPVADELTSEEIILAGRSILGYQQGQLRHEGKWQPLLEFFNAK